MLLFKPCNRGLTVQMFDKKSVIGVPVKCGEYFPVRKEMEYLLPSAGEYMHVFDVPQETVNNVCKTIRVISPKGTRIRIRVQGLCPRPHSLGATDGKKS